MMVFPLIGYCDFEYPEYCFWRNDVTEDTMDWLVGKGATPSQYTGPISDHTTGGKFGKSRPISCHYFCHENVMRTYFK